MRIVVLLALIVTLGFGNFVDANVSGSARKSKIINYSMGSLNAAVSLAFMPCAHNPTSAPVCMPAHVATALQATQNFLQAALGEGSCDQSSNGSNNCFQTPPPGPPPPWTTTSTSGGTTGVASGTMTGGTTGFTGTGSPFPRGSVGLTGGTTGFRPPSMNALVPSVLANRPELKNILAGLKDKGYTFDFDKGVVNTPKGPISMSSPDLPGALGATSAGMAALAEVSAPLVEKAKKDLEKKLAEEGLDGGGGGGAGMQAALPGEDDMMKDYMKRMMARMPAQEKNNINGLSIMVNGEPIGIAQGNIFKTIEMRYDKLEQSGIFLAPPVK